MHFPEGDDNDAERERDGRAAPRRMPPGFLESLMDEFPWLQALHPDRVPQHGRGHGGRGVARERARGRGRGGRGRVVVIDVDPEPRLERDPKLVRQDLRDIRNEWAWDDKSVPDFYTFQRGGGWTESHAGKTSDHVSAFPKHRCAREWCVAYGWPTRPSFSRTLYTPEGANQLARELCRRAQHFYNLWYESDDPLFNYTAAQLASCANSWEFAVWAALIDSDTRTGKAIDKVQNKIPVVMDDSEDDDDNRDSEDDEKTSTYIYIPAFSVAYQI